MSVEFSVALENLKKLIAEFSPLGDLSNEAQTRFSFIDRVLQDCLGWLNSEIRVEVHENGDRTDYECGSPRAMIVEAKRSSALFSFPARSARSANRIRLDSLLSYSEETGDAIRQAQRYCQGRGVDLAIVSNGPQLIVFLATRTDGVSPLSGDAIIFDGYDDLVKNFTLVFDLMSESAVLEGRYKGLLLSKSGVALPAKLSSLCVDYYGFNYSSDFQESLKNAASLVIEDLGRSAEVEKEFLEQCYCESGPLSQYSMLGKNILAARYSALFSTGAPGSQVEAVNPKKGGPTPFPERVVAEAMSRRPLTLLGDVGVGKTSFLKHLINVSGKELFKNAISIYFDLGAKASLSATTKDALLNEIERTLREDLKVNRQDAAIVEAIYSVQLREFDGGIFASLRQGNPQTFALKRAEYIADLVGQRESHLRLLLAHVAKTRAAQVVITIDNADQRSADVQSDAFVIAQELSASWSVIVFIALRPQTFHASKRSGAVSAYPSKVFVIPPPKLEDAIEKRLLFAQQIAEGRLPITAISGVSLHLDSLATLIRALRQSLIDNPELLEFLVNVSAGNIRLAVELVSRFFGNPNVQSEKIVRIMEQTGHYLVPIHEFAKTALFGDYSHFQENSSVASNVFDISYADGKEHFLSLFILGYLSWDTVASGSSDGFVRRATIINEMQNVGFAPAQIEAHLIRLNRKKLIESTERKTLETEDEIRDAGLPESFRITSLGAYIRKKWGGDFAFLEAMCFDTPILDAEVRTELAKSVNDDRLFFRNARATAFRQYLSGHWQSLGAKPYFDWEHLVAAGSNSFNRVARRLADLGQAG